MDLFLFSFSPLLSFPMFHLPLPCFFSPFLYVCSYTWTMKLLKPISLSLTLSSWSDCFHLHTGLHLSLPTPVSPLLPLSLFLCCSHFCSLGPLFLLAPLHLSGSPPFSFFHFLPPLYILQVTRSLILSLSCPCLIRYGAPHWPFLPPTSVSHSLSWPLPAWFPAPSQSLLCPSLRAGDLFWGHHVLSPLSPTPWRLHFLGIEGHYFWGSDGWNLNNLFETNWWHTRGKICNAPF